MLLYSRSFYQGNLNYPPQTLQTYKDKEQIEVFANEFDSIRTQIPFSYYYLNYCPAKDLDDVDENLGSILLGETTQKTPYFVSRFEKGHS